ncbi:AAA family ATPase [Demequina lignilytica]|uniref:AAA family ATPase n=1 Tax=Demequina lignilytica TaxID=3051663 RepID=A0AB35MHE7_9MICO|nr:AAA family ATPase [Demequina sp. SYSU T0a273]MDN4483199.1 AAA family ATPase [Demequina sp. SYSU T0a273]
MNVSGVAVGPAELAEELGVTDRVVRRFLRRRFPRENAEVGEAWSLDPDRADAVRKHFSGATPTSELSVSGNAASWTEFAALAAEVLEARKFDVDANEGTYKRNVARRLADVRESVDANHDGWVSEFISAFDSGDNLVYHLTRARFRDLVNAQSESARAQILRLWGSDGNGDAVAAFGDFVRESQPSLGPGDCVAIASNLLLATGDAAPYRAQPIVKFMRFVGVEPAGSGDIAGRWDQFIDLLDEAGWYLRTAGVAVGDRIDAQSIIWFMTRYDSHELGDELLARRIRQWRGEDATYERRNRIDATTENAAWEILLAGLNGEQSPLAGIESAWTEANGAEVALRIDKGQEHGGGVGFYGQLETQFAGAEIGPVLLLAELQLIRQLATSGVRERGARDGLAVFNRLAGAQWELSADVVEALRHGGVFGGGTRFNQDQWRHIMFGARVCEAWAALQPTERADALASPWDWLDFLESVDGSLPADVHMRTVLAYVAWPNFFHPIISTDHIARIRAAFRPLHASTTSFANRDIQSDLHAIDRALVNELKLDMVNFYESPVRERWQPGTVLAPFQPGAVGFADVAQSTAADLHMNGDALARIGRAIQTRKQVVFYGPPGTGKTYVARTLARAIAQTEDAVRLVQFHPSYAYEDFFEGFRPSDTGDKAGFALQRGPLRLLAASAADNPDLPHFLIIDEMNRGNLAKVFGELYFLLEYRGERASLLYSPDTEFSLPDNLHIIGTMNTTDRSIGLVDAAIRRRFAFIEFHPDSVPVEGVLARFLAAQGRDDRLDVLLRRLNMMIEDRDLKIGPSYFMRPEAAHDDGLSDIWDFDILPLLFEHFYGHMSPSDVRDKFSLERLLAADTPGAE